jgi:hypothetical protein
MFGMVSLGGKGGGVRGVNRDGDFGGSCFVGVRLSVVLGNLDEGFLDELGDDVLTRCGWSVVVGFSGSS